MCLTHKVEVLCIESTPESLILDKLHFDHRVIDELKTKLLGWTVNDEPSTPNTISYQSDVMSVNNLKEVCQMNCSKDFTIFLHKCR